jgi:hypothetical protein
MDRHAPWVVCGDEGEAVGFFCSCAASANENFQTHFCQTRSTISFCRRHHGPQDEPEGGPQKETMTMDRHAPWVVCGDEGEAVGFFLLVCRERQ